MVAWISGNGNYSWIHYTDGTRELKAYTLQVLVERYPYLIRIHKQTAVNPSCVVKWELTDKRCAVARVQVQGKLYPLPVARRRVRELRSLIRN